MSELLAMETVTTKVLLLDSELNETNPSAWLTAPRSANKTKRETDKWR